MHDAVAGKERPVLHLRIPGQQHAVGNDGMVAQPAIVPHVAVGHEKIVRADDGFLVRLA